MKNKKCFVQLGKLGLYKRKKDDSMVLEMIKKEKPQAK